MTLALGVLQGGFNVFVAPASPASTNWRSSLRFIMPSALLASFGAAAASAAAAAAAPPRSRAASRCRDADARFCTRAVSPMLRVCGSPL